MEIRWVFDHVEVFSPEGEFLFSADDLHEAHQELEEMGLQ